MRILVAEDEAITRRSLARQLEQWGHTITLAEDGELAWERFEAGGFDIVVTDWEMPRLSGPEFVRRIRQSAGAAYVYIIMLTSRSNKSDIVEGIEAGPDDFVSKPFDREELRVRLLAGQRVVGLERALNRQNAELRDANERVRHGLRAAARVQRAMLPQGNIVTPRVRTAWTYVPTEELAGDAIGLHLVEDRYLVGYVIDVSGHGVPAALLSVTAMNVMKSLAGAAPPAPGATAANGRAPVRRPASIATEMNSRFTAEESDDRFMTMVLCLLDTQTGQFTFSSAGHPPPTILRGQDPIAVPDANGLPIAVMAGSEYEDVVVHLKTGDRVFLVSDGILEQSRAGAKGQFGMGNLMPLLISAAGARIGSLVTDVVDRLAAWAGTKSFADDVSLVAIEWLGP